MTNPTTDPIPGAAPLPGAVFDLALASHLHEHLLWMRLCGRANATLHHRRRAVCLLAERLGSDPFHASYADLISWQHSISAAGPGYLASTTYMVRPYFRWLHQRGLRADDPAALLPVPPVRRRLPRPMPEDRVMSMLEHAPARLLPWLLLAGWSGLRACEIARCRVEDFFPDAGGAMWVHVTGKGDRERHAPVAGWAWTLISATLPESGPCWRRERGCGCRAGCGCEPRPLGRRRCPVRGCPHVSSQDVSQRCNSYLHQTRGVPDTLHSLRHRVATLALEESGGDLRRVQELLGHSNPSVTQVYTRVAPARLSASVEALPRPTVVPRAARHLHVVDHITHGGSA